MKAKFTNAKRRDHEDKGKNYQEIRGYNSPIDNAKDCKCKSDSQRMIYNLPFNQREDHAPRGVTLYKVDCMKCKNETNNWAITEEQAVIQWNKLNNLSTNA